MDYETFLASKALFDPPSGMEGVPTLPDFLKPHQAGPVAWGLRRGRWANFKDTGLGKSLDLMVWMEEAVRHTDKPGLIFTPLAVAKQFVREGAKFGIPVTLCRSQDDVRLGINVCNVERMHLFPRPQEFGALGLDESSILAAFDGKTRRALNDFSAAIPFRQAATATPSPNDLVEIINHAEFLGVMGGKEIIALFFRQDGNTTHKWRLKGHAREAFWRWLASWAITMRRPSDLGYPDDGYVLPPLNLHQHTVEADAPDGMLLPVEAITMQERLAARRDSVPDRVRACAEVVDAEAGEQWAIWCNLNAESEALVKAIPGAVEVRGSHSLEYKEDVLDAFTRGEVSRLVTKPTIAGFGMNWQQCARVGFVGLTDSHTQFYQALRRFWRFGQERAVEAHVFASVREGAVLANVQRKDRERNEMMDQLIVATREHSMEHLGLHQRNIMTYREDVAHGSHWTSYLGDSVKLLAGNAIPDESVGLSVFSPPFPGMYAYTNSPHDMGNVKSMAEMVEQYRYLIPGLLRVTMPGRHCFVHLTQGVAFKGTDGHVGLKDFRGEVIRAMEDGGWIYYGEICVDKNPQVKAVRTKDAGLQFKSLATDAARLHVALADYVLQFRKPGDNPVPIKAALSPRHRSEGWITPEQWIRWARPVWYAADWMPKEAVVVHKGPDGELLVSWEPAAQDGIRETDVLNVQAARETDDERHLAPLQLGLIERVVLLWSNPGERVFSPFGGIGSEGHEAVRLGREAVICELKESYWRTGLTNLRRAEGMRQGDPQQDLFATMDTAAD